MSEPTPTPDFDGLADEEDRKVWAAKMRQRQKEAGKARRGSKELSAQDRARLRRIFEEQFDALPVEAQRRERRAAERQITKLEREERELQTFAETLGPEFADPYRRIEVRALKEMHDEAEKAVRRREKSILSRPVRFYGGPLPRYAILVGPYEFVRRDGAVYLRGVVYYSSLIPPRHLAVRIPFSDRQRDHFLLAFRRGGVGRAPFSKLGLKRLDSLRAQVSKMHKKIEKAIGPVPMTTVRKMLTGTDKELTVYSSSEQVKKS